MARDKKEHCHEGAGGKEGGWSGRMKEIVLGRG